MYELGLPAPVDSRGKVISSFFTTGGTPVPQPTATNPPQPTPTDTPTSIPTSGPAPTSTAAPSPTNAPPSSPTPAPGSNLVQNGGCAGGRGWVSPRRRTAQ